MPMIATIVPFIQTFTDPSAVKKEHFLRFMLLCFIMAPTFARNSTPSNPFHAI
jgi:hypothetical protein